jgi:hypothetical protein
MVASGLVIGATLGAAGYTLSRINVNANTTAPTNEYVPLPSVRTDVGTQAFEAHQFAETSLVGGLIGAVALAAAAAYISHPIKHFKKQRQVKMLNELFALETFERDEN